MSEFKIMFIIALMFSQWNMLNLLFSFSYSCSVVIWDIILFDIYHSVS